MRKFNKHCFILFMVSIFMIFFATGCNNDNLENSSGKHGKEETMYNIPPIDEETALEIKTASFAMGWFWGPDAQFGQLDGVVRTRVGYSGGEKENPTYRSIGDHTETLEIDYNPEVISYGELLEIFWDGIDPLSEAISRQYMSIIFHHDREQEILARETKLEKEKELGENLYVEIKPAEKFYLAEDYHQKYFLQHNAKLRKELRSYYSDFNDLVDSTAAARINGYLGGYGDYHVLMGEMSSFGLSSSGEEMLKVLVK